MSTGFGSVATGFASMCSSTVSVAHGVAAGSGGVAAGDPCQRASIRASMSRSHRLDEEVRYSKLMSAAVGEIKAARRFPGKRGSATSTRFA